MSCPLIKAVRSDDKKEMVAVLNRSPQTELTDEVAAEHLFRWLRSILAQGRAESTVDAYGRSGARFLTWLEHDAKAPLGALSACHFFDYQIHLHDGMKRSSVNRHLNALRVFSRYLHITGVTENDPARHVQLSRADNSRVVWIGAADARKLYAAVRGITEQTVLLTYMRTGLRKMELADLKLSDVDLETNTLMVYGKKTRSHRQVPMSGDLARQLSLYLAQRPQVSCPALFITEKQKVKLYPQLLQRWWSRWLGDAGLSSKQYCIHSLRHTAATNWLRAGLNIRQVAELMGHADINTTMRYLHIVPEELRQRVHEIEFEPLDQSCSHATQPSHTVPAALTEGLIDAQDRFAEKGRCYTAIDAA
jgi:integrase/recombinase XerD